MKLFLISAASVFAILAIYLMPTCRSEISAADIQGTFRISEESKARIEKLGFRFEEVSTFSFSGDRFVAMALPACVFDSPEKKGVNVSGTLAFGSAQSVKLIFSEPRPFGVISQSGGFTFERKSGAIMLVVSGPDMKSLGPLIYEKKG